jgi:hypothetical protein
MRQLIVWVIVAICLLWAWQAGVINSIIGYFQHSYEMSQQEQVIQNADGSVTTVKYGSIFNLFQPR